MTVLSTAGPTDGAGMPPAPRPVRRTLLIIGGAEDKLGRSVVLRRFVRLAGGRSSRIVVIPTASSFSAEAAALYRTVFARLKAGPDVQIVHPPTRAAASSPEFVATIDAATGVFMTGGSQLKLSQNVVGTPVGDAIHRAYRRGAVIAGTSAGASIMSQFMISLGDEGITPRQRSSQLSAGLGLLTGVVVDRRFDPRGRYGRLLARGPYSPSLPGVATGEHPAAEIRDERLLSVVGAGAVFVLDAREAVTDAPEARRGAPLLVSGAKVHTLPTGATFDLDSVSLVRFVERHPDIEVAVVAAKDRAPMVPAHATVPPSA